MATESRLRTWVSLLRTPTSFYERQLKYPQLWKPSAVVVAAMVAFLLAPVAQYLALAPSVRPELVRGLILAGVAQFFTPFVYWAALLLFWRLTVPLAGGTVRFVELVKLLGWGFLGTVVTGVARAAGYYVALRDETYGYLAANDAFRSIDEMGFELTAFGEWASNAHGDPAFVALFAVGVAASLVSVYLWTHAVVTAGDLSRRRAVPLVVLPHAAFVYAIALPVL